MKQTNYDIEVIVDGRTFLSGKGTASEILQALKRSHSIYHKHRELKSKHPDQEIDKVDRLLAELQRQIEIFTPRAEGEKPYDWRDTFLQGKTP